MYANANSYSDSYGDSYGNAYGDTVSNTYTYAMSARQAGNRVFYVCIFKHSHRCHRWRVRRSEWICH
jgi:hypothetical protein